MEVGISAVSYESLLECIGMGFSHIQLGFLSNDDLVKAIELRRSLGIDISVHCPLPNAPLTGREPFDLATTNQMVEDHTKKVIHDSIESAALLESSIIVIHFPSAWTLDCPTTFSETLEIGAKRIKKVCDEAAEHGATVLVENSGPSPCFFRAAHYACLLRSIDRENVGLCLDLGHLHLESMVGRVDEKVYLRKVKRRIKQIHVWNTFSLDEYIQTHNHHLPRPHQNPRAGWMDIPKVARILKSSQINEAILETNSTDPEEISESRNYIESLFAENRG